MSNAPELSTVPIPHIPYPTSFARKRTDSRFTPTQYDVESASPVPCEPKRRRTSPVHWHRGVSIWSKIGLFLSAIPVVLYAIVAPVFFSPLSATNIVHYFLNGLLHLEMPDSHTALTGIDIVESLFDEGVAALDPVKQHAGRDYVFMLSMEQRQASGWFVAGAAAAAYASVLPLEQRHPLHFIFLVSALFMAFINANHAGLPLGWNPLVTDAGELLGMVLGPFWLVTALFNFKGFVDSRAALKTLQNKTD